jgi:NAD(P)-dependent dehydrogenase (short-subunit alcohol dehydrogenase family)
VTTPTPTPPPAGLAGQNAVVVVGAGDGIGRAVATLLAARGVRVAALDRDLDGARKTVAGLDAGAPEGLALQLDVTDDDAVPRVLAECEQRLGGISVLVNCAGITGVTNRRNEDVDLADWDLVHAVNLRGAFLLSRAVLR